MSFIKEMGKKLVGLLPTKLWLSYRFKKRTGYKMDWKNPVTYNQKIQWLKVYDRKDIYTTMVDKYAAKQFVAQKIGQEYIVPTLGVWDKFDQIDFDKLPNQFVLKCTHDSGGLIVVKDKSKLDVEKARKKFKVALARNPYTVDREWPYKNVKPRIIAEQYLVDESGYELKDYKFYCFDGEVKVMMVASGRNIETKEVYFDFFDKEFNHLDFRQGVQNAPITPKKPKNFEEMIQVSQKLSQGVAHLRVDLYSANDRIYFGELTFYDSSGMEDFDPKEWDYKFGEWITLPKNK